MGLNGNKVPCAEQPEPRGRGIVQGGAGGKGAHPAAAHRLHLVKLLIGRAAYPVERNHRHSVIADGSGSGGLGAQGKPLCHALPRITLGAHLALHSTIFLRDGNLVVSRAHSGPLGLPLGEPQPLNRDWVTGRAVLEARTIHVPDLAHSDEYPDGRERARHRGDRFDFVVASVHSRFKLGPRRNRPVVKIFRAVANRRTPLFLGHMTGRQLLAPARVRGRRSSEVCAPAPSTASPSRSTPIRGGSTWIGAGISARWTSAA